MNNDIFLITSGAYSNDEITSDFGMLPTSFLPVGHKRLFELQIDLLKDFKGSKFISLPYNYKLASRDMDLMQNNDIKIHRTNPELSLSLSILGFLNALDLNRHSRLFILHGDTLFDKLNFDSNLLYYSSTDMFYKWGDIDEFFENKTIVENKRDVISGYFSFNDIPLLKSEINKYNSFELALKGYHSISHFKMIKADDWLDFGHSNLYYRSKRKLNVTRSFNKTNIENNHIRKESKIKKKIIKEFKWFNNAPDDVRPYLPQVWGFYESEINASYAIEFIGAPTLQEKYVFGNLPDYVYLKILDRIFDFVEISKSITSNFDTRMVNLNLKKLYLDKTKSRVNDFLKTSNFNVSNKVVINSKSFPSLTSFSNQILKVLEDNIENINTLTFMHGDLCFSNILFDSRSNNIKIIDPRGSLNKNLDDENIIYGDFRYDLAKLGHSLIGNYDFIVSGFYNLKQDLNNLTFEFDVQSDDRKLLKEYFYNKCESLEVSKTFIKASITNLFLSMLPLHDEDKNRQIAFLLNAYQFYYN